MPQGMETNQESLLSTSNSCFSMGDSSLLSNYLSLQAQKPGNHLFYHRKPMIRSHSKLLLTAAAQGEDAEVSKPPWFASSNAALSSANTLRWGSSTALKESSENLLGHDCSSQALSELDQSKGDSVFLHRTPSFSCIESSECYESGAETTTMINMNGERFHCSKSKEVDAWANNRKVLNVHSGVCADNMEACDNEGPANNIAATDNKVGVHHNVSTENMVGFQYRGPLDSRVLSGRRVSSNKLEALDLLVYAAIQVGFLDDEDDQNCDASLSHAKRNNCASDASHDRYKDGFPVHLNSPILKKRVVRRARSAFSKQTGSNVLQRLGISSPAKNSEKKVNINIEKDDNSINNSKADHTQQQSKAIQYTRRNSKVFSEKVAACKTDAFEMILMENGSGSKQGGLQASPTKASDVCNTYLKVKDSQYKTPMKQHKLQDLPTPELCGPLSKPLQSAVKPEMCKDLCQVECARGQKNSILEGECKEANSEVEAKQATQANNGGSLIRLKFRPMRLPSQVLQEGNIFEGCDHVSESHTITRRSERLHVWEHERRTDVTMQPIGLMLCDSSGSLDTQAKDVDLSIRSKRARSQVLPTKFSDSVLQPWKRAYRKKC